MGWPGSPFFPVAGWVGRGAVPPSLLSLASDLCFTLSLGDAICFAAAVQCAAHCRGAPLRRQTMGAPSPLPRWARHGCQASGQPAARLLPQRRAGTPDLATPCGESTKQCGGLHPTPAHLCRWLRRTKRRVGGPGALVQCSGGVCGGQGGRLWLSDTPAWCFPWVLLCPASPLSPSVLEVQVGAAGGLPAWCAGGASSLAWRDLPRGLKRSQLADGRPAAAGQPEAALLQ